MSEETVPKPRLNLQDCRNQDLVSRLLAATPSYLYSSPVVGPHNFFFSEMLRSLVQAKTNEAVARNNSQQTQQQVSIRRPRKRSWSNHRLPFETSRKSTTDEKEKPLELTNKHSAFTSPKVNNVNCNSETIKVLSPSIENSNKMPRLSTSPPSEEQLNLTTTTTSSTSVENQTPLQSSNEHILSSSESSSASLRSTTSDLALPPAPPIFFPPLYHPPYGIDPLHFFIDLRVSGHIYDRKKENISPILRTENNNCTYLDTDTLTKCRQNSAFSVPIPKDSTAVNLTLLQEKKYLSSRSNENEQMFDYFDTKDNSKTTDLSSKNTNYVLQNLPRIYTNLAANKSDENINEIDGKYNLNNRYDNEIVNRKENNFDHNKSENGSFSNDNENDDEPITIEEID